MLSQGLVESLVTRIVSTSRTYRPRSRRVFLILEACDAHLTIYVWFMLLAYDLHLNVVLIGAMLDEQPREGETPKMNGSVLVAVADSREEALKLVKEDVYTTQGVWDVEKVQIYPVCMELWN